MHYEDRLYGPAEIDAPVLLDLLQSRSVQRLQGVLQHGITGLIGITMPVSRFEHSVGVMLLVRQWGGSLQEQIAALLHDVSHTAFSHVIDHVFGGPDQQSYHEQVKEEYVATTDLPAVLASHGYDWHDFLHEDDYPLLEQPAPALCADRLDYFLRDSLDLKLSTLDDIQHALKHLVISSGRIMVNDPDVARWMGLTYMAGDEASWSNFREVGLYEVTAQALRLALEHGILTPADFWGEDRQLWARLQAADDPALRDQLALVVPKTQFVWDEHAPDFVIRTKLRTIDPDVLVNGTSQRLSALDPDFAQQRNGYLQRKAGAWPMRIVRS